jgi:hypothetical protein
VVRFIRHDTAIFENYLSLGLTRQIRIMSYQNERDVILLVKLPHQFKDVFAVLRIQVSGWFIGEQYLRRVCKRAGDRDPLLFSAGKLGRIMVSSICEVDGF